MYQASVEELWMRLSGIVEAGGYGGLTACDSRAASPSALSAFFSPFGGDWIRFSYATPPERTQGAWERLMEGLQSLAQ
jgi:hypothetical protein